MKSTNDWSVKFDCVICGAVFRVRPRICWWAMSTRWLVGPWVCWLVSCEFVSIAMFIIIASWMCVIIVITNLILINALVVVVFSNVAVVIGVVSHGRCHHRRRRRCCCCCRRHSVVVGSVSLVVRLCFDIESVSVESTDYDALYDRVMIHIHSYTYVLSWC